MRNSSVACASIGAVFLLTLFSAVACGTSANNRIDGAPLPVVFLVHGGGYQASGVPLININGKLWIATVKHTTDTATHVGVHKIVDIVDHPTRDFALVSIMSDLEVSTRISSKPPLPGDRLLAAGLQGDTMRYMDGRAGRKLGSMSCPIISGASGGPVVNEAGELVGVVQSVMAMDTPMGTFFRCHLSNFTPIHDLQSWIMPHLK